MFVFDLTDRNSFLNLENWINEVNSLTTDSPIKLIVANKCDVNERVISKSELEQYSSKIGIQIIDCSAKSSYHIDYIFENISQSLIKREELLNRNRLHTNNYMLTPTSFESKLKDNSIINKCCK